MSGRVILPYIDEYLLSLQNNNYSKETVDNYERDLEILAAFLTDRGTPFKKLDKLLISEYKGFLRNQNYLPVLRKYKAAGKVGEGEEVVRKNEAEEEIDTKDEKKKDKGISDEKEERKPGKNLTSMSDRKRAMYRGQLSSRSVNRLLSSLRSYLDFLVDIDQPAPLSSSAIKLIKTEKKEKQVADLPELIRLIECPMQFEKKDIVKIRNRAILELIFATGMRISEVVNLNKEQIRIEGGSIKDDRIYISGKGKKQRFVYLTHRAIHFLEEYLALRKDGYPAMFIPTKGTRIVTDNPYIIRLSQNYIQSKIAEYRRRLGIIVPTSAHSLRHGFATYLAEEGASPAAIQKLLGHESLQTTTRYVHASDRFAEKTHRQFHPLSEMEDTVRKSGEAKELLEDDLGAQEEISGDSAHNL